MFKLLKDKFGAKKYSVIFLAIYQTNFRGSETNLNKNCPYISAYFRLMQGFF